MDNSDIYVCMPQGPPSHARLIQAMLAVSAVAAFMGYATYCHIRRTVPYAESITPRPSTPELVREALPTPIAQPPSPAQTPAVRRREDSPSSAASPVQQLIQQFGGIQKAANDVRRSAVAALPASVAAALPAALGGGVPPRGSTTPRSAVPPQTPAAVTPPNVAASSASTDMSMEPAPAVRASEGGAGPADGAISAPQSGVVGSRPPAFAKTKSQPLGSCRVLGPLMLIVGKKDLHLGSLGRGGVGEGWAAVRLACHTAVVWYGMLVWKLGDDMRLCGGNWEHLLGCLVVWVFHVKVASYVGCKHMYTHTHPHIRIASCWHSRLDWCPVRHVINVSFPGAAGGT